MTVDNYNSNREVTCDQHVPQCKGGVLSYILFFISCGGEIPLEAWDFMPIYGVANSDDDNENGEQDWLEEASSAENDRAELTIPAVFFQNKRKNDILRLTQNDDGIKLYLEGTLKSNSSGDNFLLEAEDDLVLEVEFQTYNQEHTLTLSLEENGDVVESTNILVHSAPIIIANHLQPAEFLVSMEYNGFDGNQDFIDGFADILGDKFIAYPLNEYNFDVWIQDEIEFGLLKGSEHQTGLVIDSIRNRGLKKLAANELFGKDMGIGVWGSGFATSQDSFGNLEATPPITVDGKEYPFGRVYYGKFFNEDLTQDMKTMLDEQEIQAPIELDVGFLCVGHVDEFVTFLPDPSAPKGFRLYVTDVDKGYEFLASLPASHSLPLYEQTYQYSNVGEILADNTLRSLNEEVQATYIEPNIARFKSEFGLSEEDIVRVPMIFEEPDGCYGATATLMPGVVNMAVFTHDDQQSADAFIPDPFFRSNLNDTSSDPYIEMFTQLLPSTVTPHWLNDWEWYHVQLGEVHCGSNIKRTMIKNWWEE